MSGQSRRVVFLLSHLPHRQTLVIKFYPSRFSKLSRLIPRFLPMIARIKNSISYLKRMQEELQEYAEDPDVVQVLKEDNEMLSVQRSAFGARTYRASRDERILTLKLALSHRGASNATSTHGGFPMFYYHKFKNIMSVILETLGVPEQTKGSRVLYITVFHKL
ncbi:uncharacterized protein EDB91DRAFT_1086851 [Suillus paluster]|uniref:uncharacterized protein n=1 Tax=Suillus paluster TaxID=48578 RepID=UPI001B8837FA|nr:uncharacterized protein EDB91DRAFT_1086851 [Suillus paluster]KAG1726172.1 hypothetical protein EDB91DRAFT_1086851 [Suillus paluster]